MPGNRKATLEPSSSQILLQDDLEQNKTKTQAEKMAETVFRPTSPFIALPLGLPSPEKAQPPRSKLAGHQAFRAGPRVRSAFVGPSSCFLSHVS